MSDRNKSLTVLLPLRDRVELTYRWMDYADQSRFPFKVVIADGGSDEKLVADLSSKDFYPNLDYQYKKFLYDSDLSHYYAKMVSLLSDIKTPFVALTDNDSFPIASGLEKSLHFLLEHPEYSACRGQHLDFVLEGFPEGKEAYVFGPRLKIHRLYYDKRHTIWKSLEADDPLERIEDWSHCTNINYYNVHRREHVLAAWQFIAECDLMDLFVTDIAVTFFTLAAGKTKVFDFPFMMRQQNTPVAASKEAARRADILDRMFIEKWTADINRLMEAAAWEVCKTSKIGRVEIISRIKMCLKNHYADRLFTFLKQREISMKRDPNVPDINISDYMVISNPEELQGDFISVAKFLMPRLSHS
jgi:glycosyltransferase domain-containing protein